MVSTITHFHKRGFTLIELLVVIAIIAILAAILVPAVQKALDQSRMTTIVSNGRNIYMAIQGAELGDIMSGKQSAWPQLGSPTNPDNARFENTDDYFVWMVTSGVMRVEYSFFAAPGMQAVTKGLDPPGDTSYAIARDFVTTDHNNAWALTSEVRSRTSQSTPVIFTRNITRRGRPLSRLNLPDVVLDPDVTPFGSSGAVVVNAGGAGFVLKASKGDVAQVDPDEFNPGEASNETIYPAGQMK